MAKHFEVNSDGLNVVRPSVHRFGYVLCAGALMSYVPNLNFGTVVFLFSYVVLLLLRTGFLIDPVFELRRRGWVIVLFVFFSCLSIVWLILHGGELEHWVRAIVPFLFLVSWFHLPSLRRSECEALANWLLIATIVWVFKILVEAGFLVFSGSDVLQVRLTTRVVDSVLPYPLVAISLLVFWSGGMLSRFRWIALAFIVALYVWIGYRGGLLLVIALISFGVFVRMSFLKSVILVSTFVLLMSLLGVALSGVDGMFNDLISRFASIQEESEGIRALEWKYALSQWLSSPVIGLGLGWQVPAEIAFFGVESLPFEMPDSVGYLHSVVAYFLMSLGVVGLLLYLAIIRPIVPKWTDFKQGSLFCASAIALFVLFFFFLTQASFRQIQTTMMLVCLVKINLSLRYVY